MFSMLHSNNFIKTFRFNFFKDQQNQKQINQLIEAEMKRQLDAENKIVKMLLLGIRITRVYDRKVYNCRNYL